MPVIQFSDRLVEKVEHFASHIVDHSNAVLERPQASFSRDLDE